MGYARLALLLLALSCRQLPELHENTCDNGVVEPGEDCDRFSQFEGNTQCNRSFCRYACDFYQRMENSPSCPPGRECGRDDLCRLPSGKYVTAANSPLSFAASELLVADIDGDSAADLIGGSPDLIDVRYGVGDGTFRESFSISIDTPRGERTLGDVDGDAIPDLLLPYLLGINVFLGDSARRLIPDAHPQLELGDFLSTVMATDARFLVGRIGGEFVVTPFGVWTDGRDLNVTFDPVDSQVVKVPAAGRRITGALVDDVADDPETDELIVAIEGEPRLWLGKLRCESNCGIGQIGSETGTIALTAIELGSFGTLLPNEIHLADLDGDGRKDIIALVEKNGTPRALILENNGTSFDAPRDEPRFSTCAPDCWPLAIASDGGLPLFVLPDVVLTSTAVGSLPIPAYLNMPTSWTLAAIADFNGDGALDIAAADDLSRSVAFLYRSGPRAFNRIDVPLPVPPQQITAGDYDGDGVSDLSCVLDGDRDEIHVVFGETSGPPTDAVFMARFPNIAHIQSTFFLSPAPWNPDRIHDLIVEVSADEASFPEHAAILVGTGRRRMHSPVPVFADNLGFGAPHHVRTGRLDANNDRDMMTLTLDGRLWLLKNRGKARFTITAAEFWSSTSGATLCDFAAIDRPDGCGVIEIGPIAEDDMGLDEAILADRSASCRGQMSPIELGLVDTVGGDLGCTRIDARALVGDRTELLKTKLAFVNNDSAIDLVLGLGGASPSVVIGFGDGTGKFPSRAEIPMIGSPLDAVEVGRAQLAILTSSGLFVVTFGGEFGEEVLLVDHVAMMNIEPNGRVLAARVNIDGLDDLIFSSAGRIHIYEAGEGFAGDESSP